ncbi:hypothetical protein PHET_07562 [Paragonimus heterotremus]|uniref:P-type phospholipid transporter n=1 Tax=Paragonimus heterotremus TaxID=100268 RepID=A0A8J4WVS0_9TREM|nr:hypothetical protein PHET_07562 [Paragonimus heterotremus]
MSSIIQFTGLTTCLYSSSFFLIFHRPVWGAQSIIPLPLYVSIEFIKMHQVWHMNQDLQLYDPRVDRRIEVRAFNILEDLGQVEYVFCDKTGTLTENKMEFKRASINGREYITDAMNGCDPDQPYLTQERSHGNLIGSFGPGTVSTFDSLRDVVNRMSLVAVTHRDTKPQLPLMTPVEQTTIECGTSETYPPPSSFDVSEEQCIQDFILALTICNTAVVSATKNTATLFQIPAPRKGLRHMLRPHTSERSKRRKQRRAARSEASSMKHTLSLGSLFSRKRRPLKAELNSIPRFQVHDEREEKSDVQTLDATSMNTLQASTPLVPDRTRGFDGGSSDVEEPGCPRPQIAIVEEVTETNEELPMKERKDSIHPLPPVVPGLVLDLPTPRALHHNHAGSVHKYTTATAGVRWRTSDVADSADSTNEQDSDVDSTISLDSPVTVRQPVLTAENETVSTDQGEYSSSRPVSMRTLTVVAHDGLSYELPVAKDFVHNVSDANSCPLSDKLLLDSYESESPDELSLVKAACRQGCKLLQRGLDFVLIWLPTDGLVGVRVMHILPFDSVRKRMSILIRHPATDEAVLYTKGADSAIFHRVHCANEEEAKRLELTRTHVEEFSRVGLRTLVLVKRIVPEEELKAWSREYIIAEATASDSSNALRALMDRIERNFTLLGATGIEDRLQPGVPETIGHLREAGIHVWVLTGDKQETAVNVAHSARLITKEHQLIYISASSKVSWTFL